MNWNNSRSRYLFSFRSLGWKRSKFPNSMKLRKQEVPQPEGINIYIYFFNCSSFESSSN